jgi:hypothetical protein
LKNYIKYAEKLRELSDIDKLKYLVELKYSEKLPEDFEIQIDNDDVYIHFGYDEDDNSIGLSFDEFGYHLLPTIFNFIGLKSDFV